MRQTRWLRVGFVALLPTMIACGDDGGDGGSTPDAAGIDANNQIVRTAVFQTMAAPHDEIAGSSVTVTLDPDNNQVIMDEVTATNLPPGDVVTIWWAVFNNPEACENPQEGLDALCFVPDMGGTPAADGALLYAGPHPMGSITTVAEDGVATFPRLVMEVIASDAPPHEYKGLGPGNGLNTLLDAEIWVTLQKHGPTLTGADLLAQETTFGGGCRPGEPYEEVVPSPCALFQLAPFPAQ